MFDDKIRIKESDPPTTIYLTPTVPVSCPTCTTTLDLGKSLGLDVSDCTVTWTGAEATANKTITIQPFTTFSSFSRVARIAFNPFKSSSPGSHWDGYKPAHCPVGRQLLLLLLL